MKKPILVSLILLIHPLNALTLEAPTTLLVQLIPSVNYSVWKNTAVPCAPKFSKFPRMSSSTPIIIIYDQYRIDIVQPIANNCYNWPDLQALTLFDIGPFGQWSRVKACRRGSRVKCIFLNKSYFTSMGIPDYQNHK